MALSCETRFRRKKYFEFEVIKSEIRRTFLQEMIINYRSCLSKDVLDFLQPEIFQQIQDMLEIISCSARGYRQCYAENQIRNS